MKQIMILFLLLSCTVFAQGKLEKAKKELSTKTTTTKPTVESSSNASSSTISNSRVNDNDSESFQSFVAKVAYSATLGIVAGKAEWRELTPYPYYDYGEYTKTLNEKTKRSNVKIGVNYFNNLIKGFEVYGSYKFVPLIGIEASHIRFNEKVNDKKDYLDISSLMLNYYRIREKYVSLWWGLGGTYIGNEVNKLGFAYNIGTEIYPFRPVSFHFSWKHSFINNSSVQRFKANAKYHLKKTAIVAGYNNFNLGSVNTSGLTIGVEYMF
ncbi:conserved exported hypothetical protein [Tenacibaculum sp. 190524A02b]|uniref:Outer membrane protein beta-barrel domain-containing protein n=1 Tax=Tenacibaculum vairaonense TaxID=3137860 RepID=A0ABP1F8S9_9FLAO